MSHPLRIQRKRTKGWRLPEGAVCVTRPGPWGNPYKTSAEFHTKLRAAMAGKLDVRVDTQRSLRMQWIALNIEQLRGKQLACWCPIGVACHSDVLIEFANKGTS